MIQNVETNPFPDVLTPVSVDFLLACFGEILFFCFQNANFKQGSGNHPPVDAQGKNEIVTPGIRRILEIRIQHVLQTGPAQDLFLSAFFQILEGELPDLLIDSLGKLIRQVTDQPVS